jgi:hypothetical protein
MEEGREGSKERKKNETNKWAEKESSRKKERKRKKKVLVSLGSKRMLIEQKEGWDGRGKGRKEPTIARRVKMTENCTLWTRNVSTCGDGFGGSIGG